jgi:hypothetical protein
MPRILYRYTSHGCSVWVPTNANPNDDKEARKRNRKLKDADIKAISATMPRMPIMICSGYAMITGYSIIVDGPNAYKYLHDYYEGKNNG